MMFETDDPKHIYVYYKATDYLIAQVYGSPKEVFKHLKALPKVGVVRSVRRHCIGDRWEFQVWPITNAIYVSEWDDGLRQMKAMFPTRKVSSAQHTTGQAQPECLEHRASTGAVLLHGGVI